MSDQSALWRYEEATARCNKSECSYRDSGPLHQLRERVDEHVRENEHAVQIITEGQADG